MKIAAGTTNLSIVITSINNFITTTEEYKKLSNSLASSKIIDGFYEKLLLSPFVFYVPLGTIVESNSNDDFEKYADDIFYIESLYELLLCMNLSPLQQKELKASWIVCEMAAGVQKTRVFHDVAFLDYHIERVVGKKNTNGRLDFNRMDTLFSRKYEIKHLKNFLNNPRKFFFTAIFDVTPVAKKGEYEKQKLFYIDNPSNIEITDKQKEKKHNYHCPICNSQHLVYLNGNKAARANVKNYIKLNGKYIEFLCDHEGTEYKEMVHFGFDAEKFNFMLQTDEQYNQAFLYLFYKASYGDGEIHFYKNKEALVSISVEKFHEKRLEND
jgi:hypothetical protein